MAKNFKHNKISNETPRDPAEKPVISSNSTQRNDQSPFFSICIPTYNRATEIHQAIDSILCQDFTDFELVICDNASTDNTEEVIRGYSDRRIRYVKYSSLVSMYANHNRCLDLAASNWLVFVHSDDYIEPNTLSSYHQTIIAATEEDSTAIYFSNFKSHPYSWQNEQMKGIDAVFEFLKHGFFPPTCNAFNIKFFRAKSLYFNENSVFADAMLLCQICLKENGVLVPVPAVSQTWDMYRGSYKKILSSYLNVKHWKDIAFYLKENLTQSQLSTLINEMKTWDEDTISHLLYRFSCIGWWNFVDRAIKDLLKSGIEFKNGHYYKHILVLRYFGTKIHKVLYSLSKKTEKVA